jgi:hypothetical protein
LQRSRINARVAKAYRQHAARARRTIVGGY